jgi:hypothetical protein
MAFFKLEKIMSIDDWVADEERKKHSSDIICKNEDCNQVVDTEAYESGVLYCVNCQLTKTDLEHQLNKKD